MTVLVVADDVDPTTDHVVRALTRRHAPVVRVDPGHVGAGLDYSACIVRGSLAGHIGRAQFGEISAVYWRWPSRPEASGKSDAENGWRQLEHDAGVLAVLELLECTWINHPRTVREATKVRQYQLAPQCGLQVPDTAITTLRPAATAWSTTPTVIKPLRQPPTGPMIPARRIVPDEIDETIALAPTQLQREVNKQCDVRVTIIGHDMWAYAIYADDIDWRAASETHTRAIAIPHQIARGLRRLMGCLGLVYGAADLVVDRDGVWWLLEINPTGAWAHQSRDVVGQIAAALAAALTSTAAPVAINGTAVL
jgi:hypothetical protein